MRRDGIRVARCTVARLMQAMGLASAIRGRAWITTTRAGAGSRPGDLVDRQFVATRPNQLWVSDFTYVAFVIDVFARWASTGERPRRPRSLSPKCEVFSCQKCAVFGCH